MGKGGGREGGSEGRGGEGSEGRGGESKRAVLSCSSAQCTVMGMLHWTAPNKCTKDCAFEDHSSHPSSRVFSTQPIGMVPPGPGLTTFHVVSGSAKKGKLALALNSDSH